MKDLSLLSTGLYSEAVDALKGSLRIYSPCGNETEMQLYLTDLLRKYGFSSTVDSVGNVISTIGREKPNLLLCGHMDTVPGLLKVHEEEGWIFGRGAVDAKSSLIAMLFAFFGLGKTKDLGGSISFAAVVDEEGSSKGVNHLIQSRQAISADYAIFGEPAGINIVTLGYRGAIPAKLTVRTPEVHSSSPWMSQNAIEVAMRIFDLLKKHWEYPKEVKYTDRVTLCLTQISGGRAHNISPGMCTAHIDFRVPFGKTTREVWEEANELVSKNIAKISGVEVELVHSETTEPYEASLGSPIVNAVSRSIFEITHKKASFVRKTGTGDMNNFALALGVPTITYGPGNTKLSHTSNEGIEIGEFQTSIQVYELTALKLFNAK
jgi:LysW-gamma-L-lysine carboxypeptidase